MTEKEAKKGGTGMNEINKVDLSPRCLEDDVQLDLVSPGSMGPQHSNIYQCPKCQRQVEIYDCVLDQHYKYFDMSRDYYPEGKGYKNSLTKDQRADYLLKVLDPCLVRRKGEFDGLRYNTVWGTKTDIGLRETIIRILTDNNLPELP